MNYDAPYKGRERIIEVIKRIGEYKKGGSFVLSLKESFQAAVCIHGEENAIGSMIRRIKIKV